MLSTPKIKAWWKKNEADFTLGIGVFLLILLAFLVGRISMLSQEKNPLIIEVPNTILEKQAEIQQGSLIKLALPGTDSTTRSFSIPKDKRRGEYVASRHGKYYYAPDTIGVERIKPQNYIWFNSRAEAEAKGYKPAKGLED